MPSQRARDVAPGAAASATRRPGTGRPCPSSARLATSSGASRVVALMLVLLVGCPAITFAQRAQAAEVPALTPDQGATWGSLSIQVGAWCLEAHNLLLMPEPTYEELKARLEELEKQKSRGRSGSLEFRVSEKGGVSVYGLGRFPVTLYYEQWNRLLGAADELKVFLEENKSKLKLKDQ